MDFDVDQQMLDKDRKKADRLEGFNNICLKYGCHAESCDISLSFERTTRQANRDKAGWN
jgi:hypothetical protein